MLYHLLFHSPVTDRVWRAAYRLSRRAPGLKGRGSRLPGLIFPGSRANGQGQFLPGFVTFETLILSDKFQFIMDTTVTMTAIDLKGLSRFSVTMKLFPLQRQASTETWLDGPQQKQQHSLLFACGCIYVQFAFEVRSVKETKANVTAQCRDHDKIDDKIDEHQASIMRQQITLSPEWGLISRPSSQ